MKTPNYSEYIHAKTQLGGMFGFEPLILPDSLFDFQRFIVEWAIRKGRGAIFADCGLGKSLMELVFADNVVRRTNKPVLILTPLAVGYQFVEEAEKFGLDVEVSRDGKFKKKTVIANYEMLHKFDWKDFAGLIADESSILKNFEGKTKSAVTDFMRKLEYRLLGTATAAPNDYIELGTSAEALGDLGYMEMLKMFFKADTNSYAQGGSSGKAKRFNANHFDGKFRFRGHAEKDFWRWVCSWSRAFRKPSDLGFDDGRFILPKLMENLHIVESKTLPDGFLFSLPAHGLSEQRSERRRTINERCEMAASLCSKHDNSVAWCHLNSEGDLLERLIPGAVQVSGSDPLEKKEEALEAFRKGKVTKLVTKSDIAGFGSNWQHCAHQTFFPSHSLEQYYQSVRRCWRFGQTRAVTADMIASEGEASVLKNLKRKAANCEKMFTQLVELMNNELTIKRQNKFTKTIKLPVW